ncbi:MAG TPA: thioesterase family protein [Stellaceae bacterium]|nr:thioesterase family protein [Stellaceae bacterium]
MSRGIETHRSMVKAWECDVFGHFTVACYFDRFADASETLREALARERGLAVPESWITLDYHARFTAELRGGDILHVESGVLEAASNSLRFGHRLFNSATGALCTTVEQCLALPSSVRPLSEAEQERLLDRDWSWENAKDEPGFADDAADGFIVSGRDRVRAGEIDANGALALASYVHRSSFGCMQLLTAMGLTPDYLRAGRRGFSTFEVKLRLEPPAPKAGDALRLESGLMQLGSSSIRMLHRLIDARTGRRVATLRQSGVHFDLDARRSTPIPPELRDKAAARLLR